MSLVQVVSKNLTVAGTTQTSSAITTTAKNALAFCAAYNAVSSGAVTPSDSTGQTWTLVATYAGGATGLTLAVWVAKNITGNAANTFTFATTGADTPTIFVAEFSGRDLVTPFDLFLTASDTVAASGAHTTGTINARGGDDLLAFVVSGALSQSFTASGSWAIPPNGTITTATGYDAFVQAINGANNGNNPNTYAVGTADKLDAFIIALKPPPLPYSDEWLDYFNEVPEVYALVNGFQQQDVVPQFNETDFDWLQESGEDDPWVAVESASAAIGADNVASSASQYYGEDAELEEQLDDGVDQAALDAGQTTDNFPPTYLEEPWDWFQEIDDDEWMLRDTDVLVGDVVDATSLVLDSLLIADDGNDGADNDFFLDEFSTNTDADLPPIDPWNHLLTDDDDYVVTDDYLNINNVGPTPITVEDGWDQEHFGTDDADAQWTEDGYLNESQLTVEDPWDFNPNDPDDELYQMLDADPVGPSVLVAASPPPEDPWDWTQHEDDYVVPDDYAIIDVAPNADSPVDDAWDWAGTDDADDYVVVDDYVLQDNTPITPEDAWDHFTTDPDDEAYLVLDADQVSVPQPAAIEDPWDWTQDADDDEWTLRDTDAVEPLPTLGTPTDGWDHFTTDDDDWAVPDDYAQTDFIVPPSQFVDDPWDHFYENAEDNSFDYSVENAALPLSVYESDPNFEVYMPEQLYTVMWLPAGMGSC